MPPYSRTQEPVRLCEPCLLICGLGDNPAHPKLGQGGTRVPCNTGRAISEQKGLDLWETNPDASLRKVLGSNPFC